MERGFLIYSNPGVEMDLHMNCWYCFSSRNKLVMDFGLMIYDMQKKFTDAELFVQFEVKNITDLGYVLDKPKELKLVFNKEYETIRSQDLGQFFLAKEKNSVGAGGIDFAVFGDEKKEWDIRSCSSGTIIRLSPDTDALDVLRNGQNPIVQYYFRFRLEADFPQSTAVFEREKVRGAFLRTEIENRDLADIRINNLRDLSKEVKSAVENGGQNSLCNVRSVRFFLIVPRNSEVVAPSDNGYYSTRRIENELWSTYLGDNYKLNGSILCYYWRADSSQGKNHYSFLFEVRRKRQSRRIIFAYIAALIFINVCCSICAACIMNAADKKPSQSVQNEKTEDGLADADISEEREK